MMVSKLNSFMCACVCMYACRCASKVRRKQKKSCYFLVNQFLVLIRYFQNNKPYRLNRLSRNFWPVYCIFVWKIWIGVGTIIRLITIFLLLNKWYEILLSSGCQKLWMHEPGLWGPCVCVSYQSWLIFVYQGLMGAVGEDAVHISWLVNLSKHRWTLTCHRRQWRNQMLQLCFVSWLL